MSLFWSVHETLMNEARRRRNNRRRSRRTWELSAKDCHIRTSVCTHIGGWTTKLARLFLFRERSLRGCWALDNPEKQKVPSEPGSHAYSLSQFSSGRRSLISARKVSSSFLGPNSLAPCGGHRGTVGRTRTSRFSFSFSRGGRTR